MGNRIGKRIHTPEGKTFTWYVRDAQGNALAIYTQYITDNKLYLSEFNLYGSARLGSKHPEALVYPRLPDQLPADMPTGSKRYELTNHLGNVLSTVSDLLTPVDTDNNNTTDHFAAIVHNQQAYYPFGMLMPGLEYTPPGERNTRYGFNGKENDDEVKGSGIQQDYGMRYYDARLGKFLSVDPLFKEFSWNSPYSFAENGPIWAIDLDGEESKIMIYKETAKGTVLMRTVYVPPAARVLGHGELTYTQDINGHVTGDYREFSVKGNVSQTTLIKQFKVYQPLRTNEQATKEITPKLTDTKQSASSTSEQNDYIFDFAKDGNDGGPFKSVDFGAKASVTQGILKQTVQGNTSTAGSSTGEFHSKMSAKVELTTDVKPIPSATASAFMGFNFSNEKSLLNFRFRAPIAGPFYIGFEIGLEGENKGLNRVELGVSSSSSSSMEIAKTVGELK